MKRITRSGVLNGVFLMLGAAALMWFTTRSIVWPVFGVAGAIIWIWYWPRKLVANVRAHMTKKDRLCLRGHHSMETLPDGLRSRCDVSDSTVAWKGIRDVIQTQEHVFVMLDELQGYVIPKKRMTSGDLDAFVRDVERLRHQ